MSVGSLLVKLRKHGVMGIAHRIMDIPQIYKVSPVETLSEKHVDENIPQIYCLCGKKSITEALWSLISFYRFSGVNWPLAVHGDGTLTTEDIRILQKYFPYSKIITKQEADEIMMPILRDYPLCRELRKRHVFGLRLMDSEKLSISRTRVNIDTDVLFFDRPDELLKAATEHDQPNVFNREAGAEGYAIKGDDLVQFAGCNIPPEINAGLSVLRKDTFVLSELEEMLESGACSWDTYLQEQTLTAICSVRKAGKKGITFLSEKYQCDTSQKLNEDAVARHYYILVRRQYYTEGLRRLVKGNYIQEWRSPMKNKENAHAFSG